MVAIARAIDISARVLILDEPTSSLDSDEVEKLFAAMRRLRESGMAILFVTHFLDQVYAVSDRITVLRNGRLVGEYPAAELDHAALVAAMVGRKRDAGIATHRRRPAAMTMQRATGRRAAARTDLARRGSVSSVNLEIRPGEILGLAGLLGSGRTEVARLLFGLDRADAGEIRVTRATRVAGRPGAGHRPRHRVLPRRAQDRRHRRRPLDPRQHRADAAGAHGPVAQAAASRSASSSPTGSRRLLDIRAASLDAPIGELSGGNQQKCLIARALATKPRLLILDEPTRGIDVAGKQEIMNQLAQLAAQGMALLFISAEVDELLRVSTRIVVMRDRRQVGTLPGGCTEDQVYALIAAPAEAAARMTSAGTQAARAAAVLALRHAGAADRCSTRS